MEPGPSDRVVIVSKTTAWLGFPPLSHHETLIVFSGNFNKKLPPLTVVPQVRAVTLRFFSQD